MSSRDFIAEEQKNQRGAILAKAERTINGDRQDVYGNPEDCFGLIAEYWRIWLREKKEVTPFDVAMMMIQLKIARIQTGKFHEDNFIDLAGYAALACELKRADR